MNEPGAFPSLYHLCELPRPCSYLPEETAALEYRGYVGLSPAELESLVERGWRRFGVDVFRPACSNCSQCVPIRVDVNAFRPDKSQRRVWKKNADVVVTLHPAGVSEEHVSLYNRWHDQMTELKNWRHQHHSLKGYAQSFLLGDFPSLMEMQYRRAGELIGLGIIERFPNSISSVYFFHAPEWRKDSPGTFSVLWEIELARQLGLSWLYLGYWISACRSMAYKNRFRPYQILRGRPGDEEVPDWLNANEERDNVPSH